MPNSKRFPHAMKKNRHQSLQRTCGSWTHALEISDRGGASSMHTGELYFRSLLTMAAADMSLIADQEMLLKIK